MRSDMRETYVEWDAVASEMEGAIRDSREKCTLHGKHANITVGKGMNAKPGEQELDFDLNVGVNLNL